MSKTDLLERFHIRAMYAFEFNQVHTNATHGSDRDRHNQVYGGGAKC